MSLYDNTIFVNNVSDVSQSFPNCLYGQVIHGCRYRWLISYMTPPSDGTPCISDYTLYL